MHLDDERVQRLIHGELFAPAERSAREHLATCAECRRRVLDAEREEGAVDALLGELDGPVAAPRIEAIVAGASHRDLGLLRWAAGFVVAIGIAGAAYAVPGSPLKAWVGAAAQWIAARPAPSPRAPAPAPRHDPGAAGIAIAPGQNLLVLFTAPRAGGLARVSLTDGAEVVVRAASGAATFSSDADRLVIEPRTSSSLFEIEIPRAAPRVEIRVGGERVFLKDGARVSTSRPVDAGPYLLPLGPSGS